MKKVVSGRAPYGGGGLGQHLADILEEVRAAGELHHYFASTVKPGDEAIGEAIDDRRTMLLLRYTPLRFSPAWQCHLSFELFDRAVAAALKPPVDAFVGFVGQALHSFRRARALGCRRFELVAPTSHVHRVARQDVAARAAGHVEQSWLNAAQVRKAEKEYAMADLIHAGSEYTRQSFLDEGFAPDKLRIIHYKTAPRFKPGDGRQRDGIFRIVYTGALSVSKGTLVLLEAFKRFDAKSAELVLVGGSSSRGMKRCLEQWLRADPRIRIAPGDPLPHLQRADVCVHPSFQDGFGYAPVEALACGVPVIVTEDTGMKDHVREGVNGFVVPTGSWMAILLRLEQLAERPLPPFV